MKQKTAIRQLIETLKESIEINKADQHVASILGAVRIMAEELEPVNEQQIKEAYRKGRDHSGRFTTDQYFNETFEKP